MANRQKEKVQHQRKPAVSSDEKFANFCKFCQPGGNTSGSNFFSTLFTKKETSKSEKVEEKEETKETENMTYCCNNRGVQHPHQQSNR